MLAQRQPSFKECVTAHWSSCSAPKIIGAQAYHRSCGLPQKHRINRDTEKNKFQCFCNFSFSVVTVGEHSAVGRR